jgi:hypothetical protein
VREQGAEGLLERVDDLRGGYYPSWQPAGSKDDRY